MKKYLISPDWDIIPRYLTVEFIHNLDNKPIIIDRFYTGSDITNLINKLLTGVSSSLVNPKFNAVLRRLKNHSIVQSHSPKIEIISGNGYLPQLISTCVGPGLIANRAADIVANGDFTISEASGFGPNIVSHQSSLNFGWGADNNPVLARIKAIIEFIERYAIADYARQHFKNSRWSSLKNTSLTPTQLNTSKERLETAGTINWALLKELNGKSKLYAPIDFLYHPVDYYSFKRLPVCPMNISGIAGHQSRAAATVNALLELCEHEALMVAWFSQRVAPTITHKSVGNQSKKYIKLLENRGWKIVIKDISLDLTPVVMAVGLGPKGKRALTIGSASAFSAKYAVTKAISEVLRTVIYDEVKNILPVKIKADKVDDIQTHGEYYSDSVNIKWAKSLWEGGKVIDAKHTLTHGNLTGHTLDAVKVAWEKSSSPDLLELNYLAKVVFKGVNLRVFVSEITPQKVNKKISLFVIRCVVPEMARLVVGHGQQPAQTRRYKKLIAKYARTSLAKIHPIHPLADFKMNSVGSIKD